MNKPAAIRVLPAAQKRHTSPLSNQKRRKSTYPSLRDVGGLAGLVVFPVVTEALLKAMGDAVLQVVVVLHLQEGVHADCHLQDEYRQEDDGILKRIRKN